MASAPAQGETLCRNSVRNIETTTTTQTTTTQWYELVSALAPEKDSVQKLGQNRTGSSWLLLPPRERLYAETRSETLRQQPQHKQQQLNGASWLLLSPRKGLCAETRSEPHWFKLVSAPAQGENKYWWMFMNFCGIIPVIVMLILFHCVFTQKTPKFLYLHGKTEESEKSLGKIYKAKFLKQKTKET